MNLEDKIEIDKISLRFISDIVHILNKRKKPIKWLSNKMNIDKNELDKILSLQQPLDFNTLIKFQNALNIQFKINAVSPKELEYDYINNIYNYEKKKVYLISIITGSFDDTIKNVIFITFNKNKAENYVNRFNRIIKTAKIRIKSIKNKSKQERMFWHDYIFYNEPIALLETTKIK